MRVEFSDQAKRDIREIAYWIASDSLEQAERFVRQLSKAARSLDRLAFRYPIVGRTEVRRMPYRAYLIFYRVTHQVEVLRILHSARDWPVILNDDENAP
ncbi:type II toxin-antitoxin system RelE/ParE family toxin [Brevundimonas sp.]|uniref:type II toxin-antitoxin system RelE/ParE family toxin n=1 Tax=Brevundimonas sp. TaxID=1871086 RepID=UPI003A0FC4BA